MRRSRLHRYVRDWDDVGGDVCIAIVVLIVVGFVSQLFPWGVP